MPCSIINEKWCGDRSYRWKSSEKEILLQIEGKNLKQSKSLSIWRRQDSSSNKQMDSIHLKSKARNKYLNSMIITKRLNGVEKWGSGKL